MQNILYETMELNPISDTIEHNLKISNDGECEGDGDGEGDGDISMNISSDFSVSEYNGLCVLFNLNEDFMSMHVKDLKKIAKFYNIPSNRLRKNNLVDKLIEFEMNEINFPIVEKRRRFWQYMYEMLNHNQMSIYIKDFMDK